MRWACVCCELKHSSPVAAAGTGDGLPVEAPESPASSGGPVVMGTGEATGRPEQAAEAVTRAPALPARTDDDGVKPA